MLRMFRLCSLHGCSNASILHVSYNYKANDKVTAIRSFFTDLVDARENRILENQNFVRYQNVIVMRHGDRIDNLDHSWASTASRPWDPPLAQAGRVRAYQTGLRIRQSIGFPIHRVFVSPFLRCVQTASEVVAALSTIDHSKVKVSVEYGLCEMMNKKAIRLDVAPKDGNWGLGISESEAMLPAEAVDTNVERMYKELPKWEEPFLQARARYQQIFKDLANKYIAENLLLVTHGEGVDVALSSLKKDCNIIMQPKGKKSKTEKTH